MDVENQRVDQAAFTKNADRFAAFLRHTDQKTVTRDAIIKGLRERPVWEKIANPAATVDLLYIGVGTGGLEIPLTQSLIETRGNSVNMAVHCMDPSEEMRSKFIKVVSQAELDINFDYAKAYFKDPGYRPPMADFVVASHVWYYIDGWRGVSEEENSLVKFANSIQLDGVGLIALQSATSDNYAIRSIQSPIIHHTNELSGEEVAAELERLEIPHQSIVIASHTDVSCCFQGGVFNPTPEGKLLLSFILRSDWDNPTGNDGVNHRIRDDVERQLTKIVKTNGVEQMIFRDSYMWIN